MISKRVQGFTESVIREMTRINNHYGGINLAQGMPNFPPPKELVEAAHRAIVCFPKTDDMLIEAGRRLRKLAR